MKSILLVLLLFVWSGSLCAQSLQDRMHIAQSPWDSYRGLALGAGTTIVDGKAYYLLHAAPQFDVGPFGFGLDGNVRIGADGKLRKEDWGTAYDYLRWINYISFAKPSDNLYLRIGGIEHASIGHGTIVSNYWNGSSYDNRRLGFAGRVDLGIFGGEALASDLFRSGLLVLRPFVRPFQFLPGLSDVWFFRNIEIGATGALDFDTNAARLIPNHGPWVTHYKSATDSTFDSLVVNRDSAQLATPLTTIGVDISSLLWQSDKTEGRIYADYVKFAAFNDGLIAGVRTSFYIADQVLLDLRAERSFFRNQFLPSYYNSFYERDRFDDQARPQDFVTKATELADTTSGNGNGFRGGMFFDLAGTIQLQGEYLHLDNLPGYDWMNLEVAFPKLTDEIFAKLLYSRKNIDGLGDLFALDARSLLYAEVSYKPLSWLILTVIDRWTFTIEDNGHLHT
jgi:hypothetical protein